MKREILTEIQPALDELHITLSPEDEVLWPDDDTVDYIFRIMTYRGLEIGKVKYKTRSSDEIKLEFISKIALAKRQRPYFKMCDVPPMDADVHSMVLNYAYPLYRDTMSRWTRTCPGHYWQFSSFAFGKRDKESIVEILKQIVKYVDYELEEDPSKVNGWNLACRVRQFVEHERTLLSDIDCVRRTLKLPVELMDTMEGTLENGHKYAAILVHDDGKEHRCHAIHTYKAGGDGLYCMLNTYQFRYEDLFVMKPTHMVGLVQLRKMYMDYSAKE
jgi:hypothetical protein